MQYEYSNEPEDEDADADEDGDSEAAERNYVNELILQRSRNRHPAVPDDRHDTSDDGDDDDDGVNKITVSTAPTPSMYRLPFQFCTGLLSVTSNVPALLDVFSFARCRVTFADIRRISNR